jgi:spore maturation protein B
MSVYILPLLFIGIFIYAKRKKVNAYSSFVKGASGSINVVKDILPYLATILIMVQLIRVSGLALLMSNTVSPVFGLLGIPPELCELVLLKPFTGSGSLALLNDIYTTYGADSYIGRCASVIISCSDTVFYISAVYFSQTKVKKLLYALPCALVACLVGALVACLLCRFL